MRKFVKNFIRFVFNFQVAFFVLFIGNIIFLLMGVKSCTDDVKKRGLKNILDETVEEYWEADSTEIDSTNE